MKVGVLVPLSSKRRGFTCVAKSRRASHDVDLPKSPDAFVHTYIPIVREPFVFATFYRNPNSARKLGKKNYMRIAAIRDKRLQMSVVYVRSTCEKLKFVPGGPLL